MGGWAVGSSSFSNSFSGGQRLRERLAVRWGCPAPVGVPLEAVDQELTFVHGEIPGHYRAFLGVCGAEAGATSFSSGSSSNSR